MPKSFDDSITAISKRLESKNKYIIFYYKQGNCSWSSVTGGAKFSWYDENGKIKMRTILKGAHDKKCKDRTFIIKDSIPYLMFEQTRIDTVKVIPQGDLHMDPSSDMTLIVKNNGKRFQNTMEVTPFFSSKDTTHPLYKFVTYLGKFGN